jgi:regulator of nucleoside diphosphate kinase
MHARKSGASHPTIYVDEAQQDLLQRLADRSTAEGAALLRRELERAVVVFADEVPQSFVKLNSVVEYEELSSGKTRTVSVVAPQDANIDENRISVVTPVGAAVLGLVAGESFTWNTDDGRPRSLMIRSVTNP